MQHTQLSTPKPTVASEGLPKNGFNTTQSDEHQANPGTTLFSGPASVPGFTFETSSSSKPPLQSFTEAAKMAKERMKQNIRDDNRFNKAFNIMPMATGSKGCSGISAALGKCKKSAFDDATVPTKKAATTLASATKPASSKVRQFKANGKVTFLFVLVHNTEAVYEGQFESPNPAS
ncbi:hypothetical protein H1R20_g825, partial [Candolleomyces eurysporus]